MKLTKQTLKRIIKEELTAMLEQSTDDLMAKRNQVVAIAPRIRRTNSGGVNYLVRIGDSGGDIYYINKEAYDKFKQAESTGMKNSEATSIISQGRFSKLNDRQLDAVASTFQQSGDRSL